MTKGSFFKCAAILISLVLAGCSATPFQPTEVEKVVNVPNKNQTEIYNRARQWFSVYFVSGKSVIDYEDPAAGTIIGNGVADLDTDPFGVITYGMKYSLRIDTKDGKFKVVTKIEKHTNFDVDSGIYTAPTPSEERKQMAIQHVHNMVTNLTEYVFDQKNAVKADW